MPYSTQNLSNDSESEQDPAIDFRGIFRRLGRGLSQIIGLGLLGMAMAATGCLIINSRLVSTTSTRVTFSFEGFSRGEYPDRSKFLPDDLRAPEIIREALKRLGIKMEEGIQSQIRAALNIEGIVPAEIIKQRDRMRTAGQTPPAYFPDEYVLSLSLFRDFPLSDQQRASLLREITSVYREDFTRTYANVPLNFGNAFVNLRTADYFEYELILNKEMQEITDYLTQQLETSKAFAGTTTNISFRSPTTNLTFHDLLRQAEIFAQIRLNETLGLIDQNGLSRDRQNALVKIDYYLQNLQDQETKAAEQEGVVKELLAQTQARAANYVYGIKTQATQPHSDTPIVDQGLIDSLLANDSNNMLIRKALETGLEVKRIKADKEQVLERRKTIETFIQKDPGNQSAIIARVQDSLKDLEKSYQGLIANIRQTNEDFVRQKFADAIRVTDKVTTESVLGTTVKTSLAGLGLGVAIGMGLSLMGIYLRPMQSTDIQ